MEKIKSKRWMRWIKIIFYTAVVFFLIRYFQKNLNEIKEIKFNINWKAFCISMLFYFIYKVSLASLWHYITVLNHAGIRYFDAVTAYLYSILGKYIPGKVFMLLARTPEYERAGVPMRKVSVCFVLENICTLLGAAFLFLISLFFFDNQNLSLYKYAAILFVVVFVICLNPKLINFFLRILEKILKRDGLAISISYFQMIKIVFLFVLNWIIVGIGFYMLVYSIYPVPVSEMLYCGGVYGLSAIIGILAVFAPSGLGVREGIIAVGLSIVIPVEYVVIISIVSRLWATIAELILIGAAFLIKNIREYRKRKYGEEKENEKEGNQ